MIIPKEIEGKVTYTHMDVIVRDGVKLTPEEEKIYKAFRLEVKEAWKDRFR
jgi:hypothetical protein